MANIYTIEPDVYPIISGDYNRGKTLVRDSNGRLYCIYLYLVGAKAQIYIEQSSDNGATWGDKTLLSTGEPGINHANPSLAIDGDNCLHAVWEGINSTIPRIVYSKYSGSNWSSPVVISVSDGHTQSAPAIAIDGDNGIYVVWSGGSAGNSTVHLKHRKYTTSWQAIDEFSHDSLDFSLAIDSNNICHIVYYGIYYVTYDSGWGNPTKIGSGDNPSIFVNSSGEIHVSWRWYTVARYRIMYRKYSGGWQSPVTIYDCGDGANQNQQHSSVVQNLDGDICVLWQGQTSLGGKYRLAWKIYSGGNWGGLHAFTGGENQIFPGLFGTLWPKGAVYTNLLKSGFIFTWVYDVILGGAGQAGDLKVYLEDGLTWDSKPIVFHSRTNNEPIVFHSRADSKPIVFYGR